MGAAHVGARGRALPLVQPEQAEPRPRREGARRAAGDRAARPPVGRARAELPPGECRGARLRRGRGARPEPPARVLLGDRLRHPGAPARPPGLRPDDAGVHAVSCGSRGTRARRRCAPAPRWSTWARGCGRRSPSWRRSASGTARAQGAEVTTALFDTALAWIPYQLMGYLATGEVPAAPGLGRRDDRALPGVPDGRRLAHDHDADGRALRAARGRARASPSSRPTRATAPIPTACGTARRSCRRWRR